MEQSKKKKIIKRILITLLVSSLLFITTFMGSIYFGLQIAIGMINWHIEHGGIRDPDPITYHWWEYCEAYKDSTMTEEYFYEHYDEISEKVEQDGIISFKDDM